MPEKLNLTKRVIDSLPQPEKGKRVEYFDSEHKGLALRVSATSRTWFYVRWYQGKTHRLTIGEYPAISHDTARKKAAEYSGLVALGKDPAKADSARKGGPTLDEVYEWYMRVHAKPRKRSWEKDEGNYKRHIQEPLGRLKAASITRPMVRELHGAIGAARGKTAANQTLSLISTIYRRALDDDLLDCKNPAQGVTPFPELARERRLMPHELPELLKVLEGERPLYRDFFLMALLTGARRGNLETMRWADLDLEAAIWRIPMTKNGRPQTLPLGPQEVELLKARRKLVGEEVEWVFPSPYTEGYFKTADIPWQRIRDKAGIPDVRIHDLRRTLGSFMVDTGASLPVIGKTLGHQRQSSTAIYARLALDPVREAKAKAVRAMFGEA